MSKYTAEQVRDVHWRMAKDYKKTPALAEPHKAMGDAIDALLREREEISSDGKRQWDEVASILGVDGDIVDAVIAATKQVTRNRESAKAAVTDEMVERAARAMCRKFDPSSSLDEMATCDKWRRFADEARCCLEAVAPMLASARVPERTSDMTKFVDGLGWVVRLSDVPEYTKRLIEQTRDLLAAAPKPETEE